MISHEAWVVMYQHWLIQVCDMTTIPVLWLWPLAVLFSPIPFLQFSAGVSGWFHSAAVSGIKHCSVCKMSSLTAMQLFHMFDLHSGFSTSQNTAASLLESKGRRETWAFFLVLLLSLAKADAEPLLQVGRTETPSISYSCAFPRICLVHSHCSSSCAF